MPTYEFRCQNCGASSESKHKDAAGKCPVCGDTLRREYGFALKPSFQPHFNYATGQYVRNEAEFKSALSRASDSASAPRIDPITGRESQLDHKYVAVDPREMPPKDDSGMEEIRRGYHDAKVRGERE
jgi:putative FmdB family regulatory protein